MAPPLRRPALLVTLLALATLLAGCRIDADDMNDSGYRALAFDLPDEAAKYFGAARELIVEECGEEGDPRLHPQYARLRRGELLVAAWEEPETSLAELEATVRELPALFEAADWGELIRTYALAERFAEASAIARYASERHPESDSLARQRDNLVARVEEGLAVPDFRPDGP